MKRLVIKIDREKCNGCGQCVSACHEGAIQMVNGKAELVSDVYCDGLGACIGDCPTDAITMEEREAAAFDPEAVAKRLQHLGGRPAPAQAPAPPATAARPAAAPPAGGCPGMRAFSFAPGKTGGCPGSAPQAAPAAAGPSRLAQWPVQLHLVPVQAPWWDGADLLLAADCVAVALPDFQERLLRGRRLAIACPKLDDTNGYVEKLSAILSTNTVRSITVARMHVPCCGGIVRLAQEALSRSGKQIPLEVVTVDHTGAVV